MIFEKARWEVWNLTQHPYKHSLAEFSYSNPALPGVTNVEGALNYMVNVLYPNTQPPVADPGSLPLAGNSIGDFRVVTDDGDGRSAGYRWEQREGDVAPQWYKVFDVDWSTDGILAALMDVTNDLYVYKNGKSDLDENGNVIVGLYAGQTIYGGNLAGQNLTLNANSGDGVGADTGFVQVDSNFRPALNNTYDVGTSTERFKDAWFQGTVTIGVASLILAEGSITDTSGTISFDDENLTTTGNITGSVVTGSSLVADDTVNTVTLVPGSITDTSGAISFGASNLSTTGTLGAGVTTLTENTFTLILDPDNGAGRASITSSQGNIDFGDENLYTTGGGSFSSIITSLIHSGNIRITGNDITNVAVNTDVNIATNGTGIFNVARTMDTLDVNTTGTLAVTGQADIDNVSINGNTITTLDVDGNLILDANGVGEIEFATSLIPSTTNALDVGSGTNIVRDLYIDGRLLNGISAPSTIQIQQLLEGIAVVDIPSSFHVAQTFTTVGGFSAGEVRWKLRESGGPATGLVVMEIWGMNAGQPDDTNVLGTSSTFDLSTLTASFVEISFTFSTPVALAATTQYAMVLKASGVTTGNLEFSVHNADVYAGGSYQSANNPGTNGTWTNNPTQDVYFKLFSAAIVPDEIDLSTIYAFRSGVWRDLAQTQPAQNGDALFYDSVNGVWLASTPDSEVDHTTISNLTTGDAGHTQFAMLAGRLGGQTINGGTGASESLTLVSTSDATKGNILSNDNFMPVTDANFSVTWQGTDLGDGTHYWRDIYTKGEHFGFRFENLTSGTLPSASVQNIGRMVWATDNDKLYADIGTAFKVISKSKFLSDTVWNGTDLTKDVDVSSDIEDARNAHWQLLDNANNFEVMYVKIESTTASNVRITTTIPLAAGSYRLIGIE